MSSGVQSLNAANGVHVSSVVVAAPNAFQAFMNAVGNAFASLGKTIMHHRVAVMTATAALALGTIGYLFREAICSGAKASFEWANNLFQSLNTGKASESISASVLPENAVNPEV